METPLEEVELVRSFGFTRVVLYRVPGERDSECGILLSGCRQFVIDVQRNRGTYEAATCAFGS